MKTISNINRTFIEEILSEIQISESKYEEAKKRYDSLSSWLNRKESSVARFNPIIYAQGSFLLGTATKPINENDEHDVDVVCQLDLSKRSISQSALKKMIGEEIKSYAKSHGMNNPTEGKRCWTLTYADGTRFHIDVLPAIPDSKLFVELRNDVRVKSHWLETAIAITDQNHKYFDSITDDWYISNPKGYHSWFKEQMATQFESKLKAKMESYHGEVEDLPTYKVRTTLQYAVQLLKYLRDVMFENDLDNKPISIIITTLAAHAYGNEPDLLDALITISSGMREHVKQNEKGEWEIINPVNPKENFAEKWNDDSNGSNLIENFFKWLNRVEEIFSIDMLNKETEPLYESYKQSFGTSVAFTALEKASSKKQIPKNKPAPNINVTEKKPWASKF